MLQLRMTLAPCSETQGQIEREIEEQDYKIERKDQEIGGLKEEIEALKVRIKSHLEQQRRINDSYYLN